MSLFFGLIVLTIFLLLLYHYLTSPYDYWSKQGIETASNPIPGFGHTLSVLCLRESLSDVCDRLYKSCSPNTSMLGMFHLRTPVLIVRDPELVRCVLVKQFSSFQNNFMHLNEHRDWFLSKHPFLATGTTWKESRTRLLSGMSTKKLKVLFEPVKRVCAKFDEHLDQILDDNNQTEVEMKDLCLKVTGEIVCNAGLGIDDEQRFIKTAARIFESSWSNSTRVILNFFLPTIGAALGVSFASAEVKNYFANLTKNVFESHQSEKKTRNEDYFLDMVIDKEFNEETVASLISSFFVDAFESAASNASFALFRISQHPEVQQKLRQEINSTLEKYDGNVTYEALKEMTYLQQVINESIRLHMTLEFSAKICNETTTLRASDGKTCTLEPGHIVIIPAQNLQTDEKFWRDPYTFDPSRFDDDKKSDIPKYAYLPFGEGPRMCPGMRFGLLEVKTLLITILRKCRLEASIKTNTPLEMDPRSFFIAVKGGLWTKLERI